MSLVVTHGEISCRHGSRIFFFLFSLNIRFSLEICKPIFVVHRTGTISSLFVQDHLLLLDRVFGLLAKHKLYLKESKCSFFLDKVNFLGHVVSA